MNKIVAISTAAAVPTIAPAIPPSTKISEADQLLVEALEGMLSVDKAIDDFLTVHGDDAAGRDDYEDLEDRRNEHIATLITVQAASSLGVQAKAKALRSDRFIEDWGQHQQAAVSLANDIAGAPAMMAIPTATRPHPDADLIELRRQYEELLAVEEPLRRESRRLYELAERRRYELMGVNPDDAKACRRAADERWSEWNSFWSAASKEVGYDRAADRWNRASERTGRIGKKILKLQAKTAAGLQIKARVIETHDEVCKMEPDEQLLAEIKAFAATA